jgi:hypothetical protein
LLSAQNAGVFVTGTVVDPHQAGVLGAKVRLQRADGAEVQSVSADSIGAFRFEGVAPGSYDVRVEQEGFKPSVSRVRVGNQAPRPLNIILTLADVQQQVTVNEQLSQVSTNTSENLDTVTMDRSALDDLPIFDQDYITTMSRFLDSSSLGTNGVMLVVDGVEGSRAGVSASAIQQVKINQDPYSAEYSRPGRSRIEIITKPGTSQLHGTFNFVFRDHLLNARDAFALTRPSNQRRIFEGSFTGPFGKKTSFLISANREEHHTHATVFALGPSGPIQETPRAPDSNTELAGSINRQIGENHLISIRGVYTDHTIRNQGVGGLTLTEAGTNFEDREDLIYFNHSGSITKNLLNQFRFLTAREYITTESVNPWPKIVVLGAFTGGGAQADRLQTENHLIFNEMVIWSGAKHTLRAGINVSDISRRGLDDNTNRGGTYTFSTLNDYPNHPLSLLRQAGNGHIVFVENVLGGFFQDEFRALPNLQISAGVRYDWQNYFHDNNNVSPRLSLAYAPGKSKRTVIRIGGGFFYDRSGPAVISDLIRYNGNRLRQYLITDPPFITKPPFPDPATLGPTSVVRLEPGVRIPYTAQYSAGVERQLGKATTLTVTYTGTRGVHVFRSRDVNAPPCDMNASSVLICAARPDPNFNVIRQIESAGDLESQSLEIGLRGNVTRYFAGMVQYTLGRAYNNVGGTPVGVSRNAGINSFPANNYDLSGEWSRADFDQRNRFNLIGTLTPGKYFKLGVAASLYSGQPYNETTGRDDNHDGLANDRPPGVRRNSLQGPGYADLDVRWSRDFFLTADKKDKGPTITLGFDAFDVLNHVNYVTYIGNLSSPFFGKPVAAQQTRRLQVSFRFRF